jgi:hypothetical protein
VQKYKEKMKYGQIIDENTLFRRKKVLLLVCSTRFFGFRLRVFFPFHPESSAAEPLRPSPCAVSKGEDGQRQHKP